MVPFACESRKLATPGGGGNGDDDEPVEDGAFDLADAETELDSDDDVPVDVPLGLEAPESEDEDPQRGDEFVVPLAVPADDEADDRDVDVPAGDLLALPPSEDGDDGLDWPAPALDVSSPSHDMDDEPFDGEPLPELMGELPREPRFAVDWQDSEAARQLLPLGRTFAALGKEFREHTLGGDIVARGALPVGFLSAAKLRARDTEASPDMACIANGKLLQRTGKHWSPWPGTGALEQELPIALVHHGERVLVGVESGRWFELARGELQPAFSGRLLKALCIGDRVVGACRVGQSQVLVDLDAETARTLGPCPGGEVAEIRALGSTLVVTDRLGARFVVDAACHATPIPGASRFRGGTLGERDGRPKLWTTSEEGSALVLVEVDLQSQCCSIACELPWRSSDEDTPSVFDLCWLEGSRRLIVATDCGVVALRLLEDPPSSELGAPGDPVS